MEEFKEFLHSPKKTAIMGLVASIFILFILIIFSDYMYIHSSTFGLIIYFSIILFRIFYKKGNIKFANYLIIIYYSLNAFSILGITLWSAKDLTLIIINSIYLISYIIIILYFCKILLNKKNFVNNKLFVIFQLILSIMQNFNGLYFNNFNIRYLLICFAYMLIIPYFYNYYNLLKEENKNGK